MEPHSLDLACFDLLNLTPDAPAAVREAARVAAVGLGRALVALLVALALFAPRSRRAAAWRLLVGVALASAAASLAKRQLGFVRPAELALGWQWLAHSATAGFPSSHAAASAALAVGGWLASGRAHWRAAALAAALAVSWGRVAVGVHFPSDVLAGWLLGAACALATWGVWPRGRGAGAARVAAG